MGAKPAKLATSQIEGSQWAYMLVMNGVGAAVLNAGINAALAYLLNTNAESLSVWKFDPTPIAGDFAVTILIQQSLTWVIMGGLVCKDVRNGVIAPLASPPPFWLRTRLVFFQKFRRTALRAGLFASFSFILFWPPAVLIVSLIEKEAGRMEVVPWYIVTKAIFAATISILSPFVAYFALRSMGMKQADPLAESSYAGSPRVSVVVPGADAKEAEADKGKDMGSSGPANESSIAQNDHC